MRVVVRSQRISLAFARELPTYLFNGKEYTVDFRLRQFRYAVPFGEKAGLEFIEFDSPEGEEILDEMERDGAKDSNFIRDRVAEGLSAQFQSYSWEDMLRDLGLTAPQLIWAERHLDYGVTES